MKNERYLKQLVYEKKENNQNFPFNLQVLSHINDLIFDAPVTFFVGENGTGKSTMIETIAGLMGLNMEGGSKSNFFSTYQESYPLLDYCRPVRYANYPSDSYFYRAESYYNLMTNIGEIVPDLFSKNLHQFSRGESLLELISTRFFGKGFYVLDEPETGLSIATQLSVMVMIQDLIKRQSQFVIATHSPLLLFLPEAKIYEFSETGISEKKREEVKFFQDWTMIFERKEAFFDLLFQDEKNI